VTTTYEDGPPRTSLHTGLSSFTAGVFLFPVESVQLMGLEELCILKKICMSKILQRHPKQKITFFLAVLGCRTQGFVLARKALYHESHKATCFGTGYFLEVVWGNTGV
jgi:hypothetical protein